MSGGAIPATLYSDDRGVGRKFPVTTRQALFSSESIFLAWHEFPQTGLQYSAVEYESARAVVLRVVGSAPQLEFASLASRLFLVATSAYDYYDSVLSRVTPRYTGKSLYSNSWPFHCILNFFLAMWFFRWKAQTWVFPGFAFKEFLW